MKSFILILIAIVFNSAGYSQQGCDPLQNIATPPTPFENGYLKFDGKGDFLRTNNIGSLEFPQETTDEFEISVRMKILQPYKAMYIFGKSYGTGWMVGYHNQYYGFVSIYIGGQWRKIHELGADTAWHNYKITYNKSLQELRTYTDDSLSFVHSDFTYGDLSNPAAFTIGNVGLFPQYGPFSVNVSSQWFKGAMDEIKIKVNGYTKVYYNFNENAGQVARDSASYSMSDRTYPGASSCGDVHFMLGFSPAEDTCDPEWEKYDSPGETRFSSLGQGLRYYASGENGNYFSASTGYCLAVWNGFLIAGGSFNLAGGTPVKHIAKWDGANWSPIGAGFNYEVNSLTVFRGELYAAGFFDTAYGSGEMRYIAKWNGGNWETVGGGTNNVITTLKVINNKLYAGGFFTSAGEISARGIAVWDGTEWQGMGQGILGNVNAICEYNGTIYAGGNFVYAGASTCNGITRWDGTNWLPVGTGMQGGARIINTLEVYNNELYAGGSFIKMDVNFSYNLAKYNGVSWSSCGTGAKGMTCITSQGNVTDMLVRNGELYITGQFTKLNGIEANKIGKFNGTNWCQIEYGMDLTPRCMLSYNDAIVVSGDLLSASGNGYFNIVRYTPKESLTGTGINLNIPKEHSLSQNYPNPFNPTTNIRFQLTHLGFVTIKIYDVSGKEAAIIINKELNAGVHNVEFNASHLASGIYFYRMTVRQAGSSTGDFTEVKKMVLVK